jgi:hypothetical protein
MNYGKIYTDLIQRGLDRTLSKDVYVEKHHIWPKCMGGPDEKGNLVSLTAEEHFLAHQLLVKMFPTNNKLIYACQAMSMNKNGKVNMKMYGWLKKRHSEAAKCRKYSEESRLKMSKSQKGKTLSQEQRSKIANSLKGNTNSLGFKRSEETRFKMSEASKIREANKRLLGKKKS